MTGMPTVEVECSDSTATGNPRCSAAGRRQTVRLREAAPGVVEFPQLHCTSCGCVVRIVAGWPIGVTV